MRGRATSVNRSFHEIWHFQRDSNEHSLPGHWRPAHRGAGTATRSAESPLLAGSVAAPLPLRPLEQGHCPRRGRGSRGGGGVAADPIRPAAGVLGPRRRRGKTRAALLPEANSMDPPPRYSGRPRHSLTQSRARERGGGGGGGGGGVSRAAGPKSATAAGPAMRAPSWPAPGTTATVHPAGTPRRRQRRSGGRARGGAGPAAVRRGIG